MALRKKEDIWLDESDVIRHFRPMKCLLFFFSSTFHIYWWPVNTALRYSFNGYWSLHLLVTSKYEMLSRRKIEDNSLAESDVLRHFRPMKCLPFFLETHVLHHGLRTSGFLQQWKSLTDKKEGTLLALITPALIQRRPILRRSLFRQEQISTYGHLGPLFNATIGKIRKKAKFF